jgi:hypothetical protein
MSWMQYSSMMIMISMLPNKSPEPTAVAPCFCFSDALSPQWLSFFR